MSMIEKTIVYFSSPGENNTETVLALARRRAEELGIKDVVVASVIGETGVKASKIFKGFNLIIVTHHTGFKEPGKQELS